MEDPLAEHEAEFEDLKIPDGVLVLEEEGGSIIVSDVAGGHVEEDTAIAMLVRGLVVMLAPTIVQALEDLVDIEEEDDD